VADKANEDRNANRASGGFDPHAAGKPKAVGTDDEPTREEGDAPVKHANAADRNRQELSAVNAELRIKVAELKRTQLELEAALDRFERVVAHRSAMIVLLRRLAEAANDASSVDEALETIVPDLARHLDAHYCQAWLVDEQEPGALVAVGPPFGAAGGEAAAVFEVSPVRRQLTASPLARDVLERRRPLWSDDLEAAIGQERGRAARQSGLQLAMVLPILARDRSAGVLELLLAPTEERREYVVELATSVGIEIGRVIERVAMQQKLSDLGDEAQRKLGQQLHDTVAQEIAGIRMLAEVLQQRIEGGNPDAATAAHLAKAARQAQGHVRSLARGLVPATIAAGGLRAAVEQLAERMETEFGLVCEFQNPLEIIIEDSRAATNLYYISQEAVNNAVRHGKAKRVIVGLALDGDALVLRVVDDGCGFQNEQAVVRTGSGLRIMEYRARLIGGSLGITSEPNSGTTVTCRVRRRCWACQEEDPGSH
jgi:signal transduction histidine kinase